MIRVAGVHLRAVDRGEREDSGWRRAIGDPHAQPGQLGLELLHQAIEHGLQIAPRVEAA